MCCVEILNYKNIHGTVDNYSNSFYRNVEAYKLGVCQQKFSHTYLHISCSENNKSLMCLRTTGEIALASKCDISQYSVASNTFKTWQQFLSFSPSVFVFLSLPTTATFLLISSFLYYLLLLYLPLLIHEYLQIVRH